MQSDVHYLPLTPGMFTILVVVLAGLFFLLLLCFLCFVFMRLGISSGMALLLLGASLLGSYFNIPVAEIPGASVRTAQVVRYFGMRYVVPLVTQWPDTMIAVNIGGAVIPTLMSLYLLMRYRLWFSGILATAVVTVVIHSLATPVHGLGIAVPVMAPVLTTAVVSLLLSRPYAPPLAYISGSLGTLIGADLLNLDRISGLGAPVASIGGAGYV